MHQSLSDLSVSISALKKNPSALLSQANGAPIAILNHNKPAAYLVSAATWEALLDRLEEVDLSKLVERRRRSKARAVTVSLDDL